MSVDSVKSGPGSVSGIGNETPARATKARSFWAFLQAFLCPSLETGGKGRVQVIVVVSYVSPCDAKTYHASRWHLGPQYRAAWQPRQSPKKGSAAHCTRKEAVHCAHEKRMQALWTTAVDIYEYEYLKIEFESARGT